MMPLDTVPYTSPCRSYSRLVIIIIVPLVWLRHPLNLTSIKYMHTYTRVYNEQLVTQDSNNAALTLPRNKVWHMMMFDIMHTHAH